MSQDFFDGDSLGRLSKDSGEKILCMGIAGKDREGVLESSDLPFGLFFSVHTV